jgi:SAM-dependent methyltransferase
MTDPTHRFSARAGAYASTRPSYPLETLDILRAHHGLEVGRVVADLGSGTGIFTRLLLESGAVVHAVEPNDDMRHEAERTIVHGQFRTISGRAESTGLPDTSVDLVTAAQAFHWFDLAPFKRELLRILRPHGHAAFIWNDRDVDGTPFLRAYEPILLEWCPDYRHLQGKADTPAKFDEIFGPRRWSRHTASNAQQLDRSGVVGRVMSASYAPQANTASHAALVEALEAAFDRHAENGVVTIGYTTVVVGGQPQEGVEKE